MNRKLLTLDDLYRFYSTKKKSMKFNAEKEGYNLAVQVKGRFEVVDENEEGLMFCRVKAFHDLGNLNKSYIDTDVLKTKMYSINNRPILADIIEVEDEDGNIVKDFNGHSMKINEDEDKIEYIEYPVGHFINPENIELAYDKEYDRNFVYCDAVIYEEYTDTCDILRRRGGTDVSVELTIRDLAFDCKNKVLKLNDFYVQGCTLLGDHVRPGMAGSKLSLKDFAESNNSIFSDMTEKEHSKLIETLERLNTTLSTLSNFNIDETQNFSNNEKEGGSESVTKLEELLSKYNKTVDELDFETEGLSDEELEAKFAEVFDDDSEGAEGTDDGEGSEGEGIDNSIVNDGEDPVSEGSEGDGDPESDPAEPTGEFTENPVNDNPESPKFSKTFELSHDDIRSAIYSLLRTYLDEEDYWYAWVVEVFDDYFIYQISNDFYGCKYIKDNTTDTVALAGESYKLYAEFLTEEEKSQLDRMRSNYSSIETELNKYKEAELNAQREAVFNDEAYAEFVETESFKKIKENINTYSVDELRTACDLAFAKEVKNKGTFALNHENKEEKKKSPSFFAFAKQETDSSFLDSLLKK